MDIQEESTVSHQEGTAFIWPIADLLRGDYKQSEHGRVILPFTVLCRLDCILATTRERVIAGNKSCPNPLRPKYGNRY